MAEFDTPKDVTPAQPNELSNPIPALNESMKKRMDASMGPYGIGNFASKCTSAIYSLKGVAGKVTKLLYDMISKLAGLGVHISAALIKQLLQHPVRSGAILSAAGIMITFHGPILAAMLGAAGFGELGPIAGK